MKRMAISERLASNSYRFSGYCRFEEAAVVSVGFRNVRWYRAGHRSYRLHFTISAQQSMLMWELHVGNAESLEVIAAVLPTFGKSISCS